MNAPWPLEYLSCRSPFPPHFPTRACHLSNRSLPPSGNLLNPMLLLSGFAGCDTLLFCDTFFPFLFSPCGLMTDGSCCALGFLLLVPFSPRGDVAVPYYWSFGWGFLINTRSTPRGTLRFCFILGAFFPGRVSEIQCYPSRKRLLAICQLLLCGSADFAMGSPLDEVLFES